MHTPAEVVGKTALFFEEGKVPFVTRVMVTKHLEADRYIVSEYDKPENFYETIGWNFTVEKYKDQPENPDHSRYLAAYEGKVAGA